MASELMRLHIEAMYLHDGASRITRVNEWLGGLAPRFYLAMTPEGCLWRCRADLSDGLCDALAALCRREPVSVEPPRAPLHAAEIVQLLGREAPVQRIVAGPTYWLPSQPSLKSLAVAITPANDELLRDGLDDWRPDVAHRQPFMASVEGGRAVSVCASVRITARAHAAGVETLPAYRRRGHATHAVAAWAQKVVEAGAVALYSTSWDNVASQNVAAAVGFARFGAEYHVT